MFPFRHHSVGERIACSSAYQLPVAVNRECIRVVHVDFRIGITLRNYHCPIHSNGRFLQGGITKDIAGYTHVRAPSATFNVKQIAKPVDNRAFVGKKGNVVDR